MTQIITITKNASNNYFEKIRKTAEMLALAFQEEVRTTPGGNKEFRAVDSCLSFKGEKSCFLYRIDEFGTTYKLDPNNNAIQLIVNSDD